jgi:nitrite reductase/ring-hydroxylating ferredoxin subunit
MARKFKIATFSEIPEGGLRRFKLGEQDIAVFKIEGKIYATTNSCPHEQCPLDE